MQAYDLGAPSCWRMLTYADVCWRMLTYDDACWLWAGGSLIGRSLCGLTGGSLNPHSYDGIYTFIYYISIYIL
jgi:hypothetical protein